MQIFHFKFLYFYKRIVNKLFVSFNFYLEFNFYLAIPNIAKNNVKVLICKTCFVCTIKSCLSFKSSSASTSSPSIFNSSHSLSILALFSSLILSYVHGFLMVSLGTFLCSTVTSSIPKYHYF